MNLYSFIMKKVCFFLERPLGELLVLLFFIGGGYKTLSRAVPHYFE